MHESLTDVTEQLQALIDQLQTIPNDEPFGIAHNNWTFPAISKTDLVEEVQSLIDFINDHEVDDLGNSESRITDYVRRLNHLCSQTAPNLWGNSAQAAPAFQLTIDGLRKTLAPVLTKDNRAAALRSLRKLRVQLRRMEAELKELKPRAGSLSEMVERIERAYNAADQLPTDLETLAEAREQLDKLVGGATQDHGRIMEIRQQADTLDEQLNRSAEEAESVLGRCETAYSAATSVGLAAAFDERSNALSKSMWFWIIGLVLALVAAGFFGSSQLTTLSDVLGGADARTSVIALNLLLSILSVGAPVWFAWLATKQIGQRFRLAEDYAFKAAVSRAYEGFRREAARFDEDMEAKLLTSALNRLDELPLRLVEAQSHGSPWHELASSPVVKDAMKHVPSFAAQIENLARRAVSSKAKSKPASQSADE